VRSIKAHATGIKAPPGLQDPAKIPMGVEHFAAHCVVCHGAPPSRDLRNHLSDAPIEYIMAAAERTSDGRRAGGLRSRI